MSQISDVPTPRNEPVLGYAPGSEERATLKQALKEARAAVLDVPMKIAGEPVRTGDTFDVSMPHNHSVKIATVHQGNQTYVDRAISAALSAKRDWAAMPWEERAAVFLRAADLLSGPYRARINASTMLGQSKTAHQAEIDSACELIDFLRFNVAYSRQIMAQQPMCSPGIWNRTEIRPLDGFVFALTPFNFTAIAGNLPTAPAMLGNAVVWKPASTQAHAAHVFLETLEAAGLPKGVINLVHGSGPMIGRAITDSPDLGGIHFTGSTATFQSLWAQVGKNIDRYRQYPRLVGETGGKDFIFAHASADPEALACAIVRGGYEFQGQKCSAASRVFVPKSLWQKLKDPLVDQIQSIKVGDVENFTNFMGAVIDNKAYDKITGYIQPAKADPSCKVLAGGRYENSTGFFIHPTLIETTDPKHRLMREEIFGPVVTLWVYPDAELDKALELCDTSTPYALTGAVFATDRGAVQHMSERLRFAAGNFYVNDKPTGAVVGQQPFGGSRASGTNDKAGSLWNLTRWASPRSIKETFVPPTNYRYAFMGES